MAHDEEQTQRIPLTKGWQDWPTTSEHTVPGATRSDQGQPTPPPVAGHSQQQGGSSTPQSGHSAGQQQSAGSADQAGGPIDRQATHRQPNPSQHGSNRPAQQGAPLHQVQQVRPAQQQPGQSQGSQYPVQQHQGSQYPVQQHQGPQHAVQQYQGPPMHPGQGQQQYRPVQSHNTAVAVNQGSKSSGALIGVAWCIAILTLGYMLPWAVAVTRNLSNKAAVGLLNFFLGWSFIGWVVSLVMACSNDNKGSNVVVVNNSHQG